MEELETGARRCRVIRSRPSALQPARRTRAALVSIAALAITGIAIAASAGGAAGVTVAASERIDAILELRHPAGVKRFAREVSDPVSPRYRRYSTVGKLVRRFGASGSDRRRVERWLRTNGLDGEIGATGAFAVARLSPDELGAFETPAQIVVRLASGVAPTARGAVPAALRGAVRSVTLLGPSADSPRAGPGPGVPRSHATGISGSYDSAQPRTGTPAGCTEGLQAGGPTPEFAFTPNQYLSAYGYDVLHKRGLRGQGHRVSVVETDGFRHSDVETFAGCFGLHVPSIRTHLVGIDDPLPPGDETTIDLETLTAAAPGLEAIDVYEGDGSFAGVLESMAAALGEPNRRPSAVSISLGECEPNIGRRSVRRALNNVAALAAGAGISILASSGDSGSSACLTQGLALPLLAVSVPASLPWVTAVGGTNLILDAGNGILDEIAWNDSGAQLAGGGGRSILFDRPPWQHGPRSRGSGVRLVPDIAALADVAPGYAIYCTSGECSSAAQEHPGWVAFGGTSFAAPLMAAGIVLLSQHAERHGQQPIGFANPLLYRIGRRAGGRAFFDVRRGNNDALASTDDPLGCCNARRGYDLATGWGSPKLVRIARLARQTAR